MYIVTFTIQILISYSLTEISKQSFFKDPAIEGHIFKRFSSEMNGLNPGKKNLIWVYQVISTANPSHEKSKNSAAL